MKILQELMERRAKLDDSIHALQQIKPLFDSLDLENKVSLWGSSTIDFNHLTHDEVIRVIRVFGGKWDKQINAEKIDYTRREPVFGLDVRCWQGEPPPSCKVIEVEEEVPEVLVPAHTRKVTKLVCK